MAKTTAKEKFFKAEASHNKLLNHPEKIKHRDNWLRCIKNFQKVYIHDPAGPWAAAGMYMSGKLYLDLYRYSNKAADKKTALDTFERVVKRYPKSDYRKRAAIEIRRISIKTPKKQSHLKKNKSKPKTKKTVHSNTSRTDNGRATVNYFRYSSYPGFTRVVVEIDAETDYVYGFLKKDPSLKKPSRMYVDIKNSRLSNKLKKILPKEENHLNVRINRNLEVRISQNRPDVVRVVTYNHVHGGLEYVLENYDIKTYYHPYRIVMDIEAKAVKAGPPSKKPLKRKMVTKKRYTPSKKNKKITPSAITKQLALGVRRIVIDPGHGGKDFGATGYYKGVHEKDIVLTLAKKLAGKLRKDFKYEVILTRNSDRFLTLEERTRFANEQSADLFISLHANSSRNNKAFGIETYYLNLATDDEAIRVAARENATSKKNISDLQDILTELMQNAKVSESSQLADQVQLSMYKGMKIKYDRVNNKGVKQAPFYVLLDAKMPSVLIETAFISNPMECKRLTNPVYQDRLCNTIASGIENYIKEINNI